MSMLHSVWKELLLNCAVCTADVCMYKVYVALCICTTCAYLCLHVYMTCLKELDINNKSSYICQFQVNAFKSQSNTYTYYIYYPLSIGVISSYIVEKMKVLLAETAVGQIAYPNPLENSGCNSVLKHSYKCFMVDKV